MGSLLRSSRGLAAASLAAVLLISGGAVAAPPTDPRYTAGADGVGRLLLPRRQRRLRRHSLRPRARLSGCCRDGPATPTDRSESGPTPAISDVHARRGAGPRSLQPRSARHRVGLDDELTCARRRATRGRGRGRGCGVLAGPGRRRPEVGAHRPAPTEARRPASRLDSSSPTEVGQCAPDIEDALYGWVTPRDGRWWWASPRLDDLVPGQRPPRRTRPTYISRSRCPRARSRWPTAPGEGPGDGQRQDHLVLGCPGPAGQLPDDRVGG